MDLARFRALFEYTRWANRRLFDQVAALPAAEAERAIGTQFSVPTLKGMLAHILGAEVTWLKRWQGEFPSSLLSGKDFPDLASLRVRWDEHDARMEAFLASLTETDLAREIHYRNTEGKPFRLPLWALLHHVANHGTHHRSEVATMLTIVKGSPPDTGLVTYHLVRSGQMS
ncbi:MAG: DinB family protein [Candidatus Rokubacteria bacterium]|nr:DinB family protein [Candidatus Rokubacteria bacterium]